MLSIKKVILNFFLGMLTLLVLSGLCLTYGEKKYPLKRLALEVLNSVSNKSMVVSILPVKLCLCKLASVAKGEAKTELLSVLGFQHENMIQNCYINVKYIMEPLTKADLLMVNKIYVNYTDDILPSFIANSSDLYGIQVDKVGFNFPASAVSFINRWIETATYRRLRDFLTLEDITKHTSMISVSALHFKGTWELPFDVRHTTNKKFHFINKHVTMIPMMVLNEEYLFYDDSVNDFKIIKMNFGSPGTAITIMVPNSANGISSFLSKLYKNTDLLTHTMKLMSWKRLKVSLPRFKIKTQVDWTEVLKQIGINKIFDPTVSGLSNVLNKNSTKKNIFLNKVKQKSFLEIDEMGISRHEMKVDPEILNRIRMGPGIGILDFTADRPFYFVITIEQDSKVNELLNGVFYGPE